jgi:uncharacterized protein
MSGPSDEMSLCPICTKARSERNFAPFCSHRCADIDLGRWLKGGYAIPGAPAQEAPDSLPDAGPGDSEPTEND